MKMIKYANTPQSPAMPALIAVMFAAFLAGCWPDNLPSDLDPDGLLLFEKMGWFSASGYFPDLWVLDPSGGNSYKITRGGPYNVHPSWVNGADRIIFESKRHRDHGGVSHLYVLNTRSGRYAPFHIGMDLDRVTGGLKMNTVPAVNNATGRLYYHSGSCRCIASELISGKDYQETPIQMNFPPNRMFWSDDYQYLIVERAVRGEPLRNHGYRPWYSQIVIYDSQTWEEKLVLAREGWNIMPGDLYEDNLIYSEREFKQGALGKINKYNIDTDQDVLVYQNSVEFSISEAVFANDSTLYAIGYLHPTSQSDIYEFDLVTSTLTRLTHDGRSKRNLTIYRSYVN